MRFGRASFSPARSAWGTPRATRRPRCRAQDTDNSGYVRSLWILKTRTMTTRARDTGEGGGQNTGRLRISRWPPVGRLIADRPGCRHPVPGLPGGSATGPQDPPPARHAGDAAGDGGRYHAREQLVAVDPHLGKTPDDDHGSGEPQPGSPRRSADGIGSAARNPQAVLGASPAVRQPAGRECHHDGDESRVYGHAPSIGHHVPQD